jgi:YVTN family beta-propeller protein
VNADSFTSAAVAAPSGQTPILFVTSTDYTHHFLRAIDTVTATVAATVTLPGFASSLAVTPSGDRLFIAFGGLGQVRVLDSITRNVISTINVGSLPAGMAVTPDGRFLYVANQNSNTLSKIDMATLTVVETIAVQTMPAKVAIGPAGCVSVEPQVAPPSSPVFAAASRVTMDPAGGVCVDDDVARREAWSSVFVGYRYLPGQSECTRSGYEFDGWANASSPTTVAALPMLTDPSDGKKRAFVAGNLDLVAVWTALPRAPSVFVALNGFFCTDCGVFLAWNDGVDDVIVMQDVHEVCVTGVVRIGEWSLCHDPTAPRGVLTYSLVAVSGPLTSAPMVASVSR